MKLINNLKVIQENINKQWKKTNKTIQDPKMEQKSAKKTQTEEFWK